MLSKAEIIILVIASAFGLRLFYTYARWKFVLLSTVGLIAIWLAAEGGRYLYLLARAHGGHSPSQLALGKWYLNQFRSFGYSDFARSRHWIGQAAHSNDPQAVYLVGEMRAHGFLFAYDPDTGCQEMERARQLGFNYTGNSLFLDKFVLGREKLLFLDKLGRAVMRACVKGFVTAEMWNR